MLHQLLISAATPQTRPIHLVTSGSWPEVALRLSATARGYLEATAFKPTPGRVVIAPAPDGTIEAVVMGVDLAGSKGVDPFVCGKLSASLPAGDYMFSNLPEKPELAFLAFLLASYRFTRYKTAETPEARLVVPPGIDGIRLSRIAESIAFGRDLINTPAADMGPVALADAAKALAGAFSAAVCETVGDALLANNYPMIHAVGRAAQEQPRLIDFTWGNPAHPKVTLVGKGVCFDTGGLDIKPSPHMLLMKKDMGGAATALTAARMIMEAGVKVRLRVLVPIVENSISASSFRAGDVLQSRKGLTVEIGNTDAEGRLILGDALALADEETPDLLLDFATLTGAARVALGPDLPPFYTNDEQLAADISGAGSAINDPVWRLPLWPAYHAMFESRIADLNNAGTGGMAGSITAALFLSRFVTNTRSYAHFDIYGWSPSQKSGLPDGGNPQVARLVLELLEHRYGL